MLGLLAEGGIQPVSFSGDSSFDGADAVVVNTCGFLEASKDESLGVIKEAIAAKESGSVKRVIVAGCLVQRHRAKMLEWAPGIDAMIGVFDRDRIVEAVRGAAAPAGETQPADGAPKYWIAGNALQAAKARGRETIGLTVNGKDGKGIGYFEDDGARLRLTPRHYAYLRISEGCNQNCTFCTIPSIRGKMRSKPLDRIVSEARELVRDGAFELNLIGQDTTSYGDDIWGVAGGGETGRGTDQVRASSLSMPGMLRAVSDAVKAEGGGGWVRLMYAYPSNFSDEMIDAFAELCRDGCVVPYIDMPLQHASNRVLASMRRNVTCEQQRRVIRRLRERVRDMAVRTTFISGFPGETESDHRELLEFVGEMEFDALGVFEYSKEPGTPAGTMEEDPSLAVPAEVKARRRSEIMELQQTIAFRRTGAMASRFDESMPSSGIRVKVLIDEATRSTGRATTGVGKGGTLYRGRTTAQAPMIDSVTYVQSREKLAPGEVVDCVVMSADGYDLVARPAEERDSRVRLKVVK
jgi:ribosomal protein S12 methylthiotransferase